MMKKIIFVLFCMILIVGCVPDTQSYEDEIERLNEVIKYNDNLANGLLKYTEGTEQQYHAYLYHYMCREIDDFKYCEDSNLYIKSSIHNFESSIYYFEEALKIDNQETLSTYIKISKIDIDLNNLLMEIIKYVKIEDSEQIDILNKEHIQLKKVKDIYKTELEILLENE